jgi:hypothetical protein
MATIHPMSAIGPVEILAVEFDGPLGASVAPALAEAIAAGAIRIIDLLFVTRGQDGTVTSAELTEIGDESASDWAALEGEILGLVNDEDLEAIGEALTAGASAALVVYEHVWARGLADAVRGAGGQVALRHHVPEADVALALAALES